VISVHFGGLGSLILFFKRKPKQFLVEISVLELKRFFKGKKSYFIRQKQGNFLLFAKFSFYRDSLGIDRIEDDPTDRSKAAALLDSKAEQWPVISNIWRDVFPARTVIPVESSSKRTHLSENKILYR